MTFTKLFSSITASTVWLEPSDTRVVWITMLAMADRHGRVFASVPGLAKDAVVPLESCRQALAKFLAPDPDSRTKVAEGRRIEEIDGGWRLINHAKYRAIRDEEERKAYKAEKQREYRSVDKVDKCGPSLTAVDSGSHNAEAEAEAEKKQKPSRKKREKNPSSKTALVESRHAEFKAAILLYWKSKNPDVEMPWDGSEGKQLAMWLASSPNVTIEQFTVFLRNRFKSEVAHSERPSRWISNITSYAAGPLNKFKQPVEAGNGQGNQRNDDERIARVNAQVAQFGRNPAFSR